MLAPATSTTSNVADWILVRSEARHEKLAADCIQRYCDLEYYLPRFWNRSARAVQLLFPSLVFVQLQDGRFHYLRQIPWVRSILRQGELPVRATPAVEALKQREKNGLVVIPYFRYRFAQPVRITAGPLIGQLGRFHHLRGYDRALVLLEALGMVDVHVNTIEAANINLRRQHETGHMQLVKSFSAREYRREMRRQMQRRKTHRMRKRNLARKQHERENGNGNGA